VEHTPTQKTYRSVGTSVLDDNAIISINLRWMGQILLLVGSLVYGWIQIENRISELESEMLEANNKIAELLDKHIQSETEEREKLEEDIAWYKKMLKKKK
tara:strand:+ start:3765 stop:4064 length:300 start_codon:yes stop_codon:yes gene_type:complete